MDPADRVRELLGRSGRGDGVVADVEVDVEVRVVDPVRQVEPERHLHESPPQRREHADAVEEDLLRRLVDVGPGDLRRVEQVERGDVAEGGGRLHVEERDVHPRELLHARMLRLAETAEFRRAAPAGRLDPPRREHEQGKADDDDRAADELPGVDPLVDE